MQLFSDFISFLFVIISYKLTQPLLIFLGAMWAVLSCQLALQIMRRPAKIKRWFDYFFLVGFGIGCISIFIEIAYFVFILLRSGSGPWPAILQWFLGTFALIGVIGAPFVIVTLAAKAMKFTLPRLIAELCSLLPFLFAALFASLIIYVLVYSHNAFASTYFKLHAAIKNTCLLDQTRSQCPTNLEELSYIEPLEFKQRAATADFTYTYDAATNNYTFIVRPEKGYAVVFDQRLIPLYGVDFKEYRVSTWWRDKIKNPPPFPGPWELTEWKDKSKKAEEPLDPAKPSTFPMPTYPPPQQ